MRLPRLQFSLRTLVILVVIVAALASWHGSRYARFKARLAARLQAAELGLFLLPREQGAWKYQYIFQADREPTLLDRWDRLCFGEDAGKYPYCELCMSDYLLVEQKSNAEKFFRETLELFPEVEILAIRAINRNGIYDGYKTSRTNFQRIAWMIGSDWKSFGDKLEPIVCDLAKTTTFQQFYAEEPVLIRDNWVDALPEASELTNFDSPMYLSPEAAMLFIRKAPKLVRFRMNLTAMDDQLRQALQDNYTITLTNTDHYIVQKKP